jgi:cytochrome c oxidase accessory protein FixG
MKSPDALTTTDSSGHRIGVFPAKPPQKGFWEVRRKWVQWGMLLLYVVVPWITINGHPILQLDIANRRFSILGTLFFAHEVPNLVFVAISFLMFIALFTTLFGRVWCGWSCPQTVFIDRIFRTVERWIEGDHLAQRKLAQSSMDSDKFFKRAIKFIIFAAISLLLGQIFLGYFVGPKEAFSYMLQSPTEHPGAFWSVFVMSAVVMFDFGWFREQFCLVACPYGRFQSVFMDQGSYYLAYDEKRKDCIECGKCVAVCPTGIDVRHGLQFECIACTACADACDSVMDKIKKPRHLIGYGSLITLQGKKTKFLRGRVVLYSTLLMVAVSALTYRLSSRQIFQMELVRAVDTPYQQIKDADGKEWVINHFKVRFYNLDWVTAQADYFVSNEAEKTGMEIIRSPAGGPTLLHVESGKSAETQFFLKIPKSEFHEGVAKSKISGSWNGGKVMNHAEVTLVGPWK